MKWTALEKQSTTVRITVLPFRGKPRDKIKGDVWPWAGRFGKRTEQTIRRAIHKAYIGRKWAWPTRTVWHPRPVWATRNADGWQCPRILDGRPAWTHDPTEGLQGAPQPAQTTCPRTTPLALVPLVWPPLLAARYPRREPRPPPLQGGWLGRKLPLWSPERRKRASGLTFWTPASMRGWIWTDQRRARFSRFLLEPQVCSH